MDPLDEHDIPYGDDWDSPEVVAKWAATADEQRPWRARIQDHIARRVASLAPGARVIELGSGPGFLAERVLRRCPRLASYVLLDFSEHMMALSRERLAPYPAASFAVASFKSEDWTRRVDGPFDCLVSMQAVHELRHKRHARRLYEQVLEILAPTGSILICDHTPFDDTPSSTTLYMTGQEQRQVLTDAGFTNVRTELSIESLALYGADKPSTVK
jgi:ubiquinone/menaquinone biosynthesis C-methylase UbiE